MSTMPTPTLQRLSSRGMLRSLPGDHTTHAVERKTLKSTDSGKDVHWLAPPLAPKVLAPLRHSKAADAAAMLQRIEYLEIADVIKHVDDSKNYYVINVYLKHEQSRIPTNQSRFHRVLHAHTPHHHHQQHDSSNRSPDFTIHRRFSEFEKLRKDLWETVQHAHRHFCSFCDGFMFLLLFSSAQPGMLAKTVFRSADVRAKILDKYLHKLVTEFQLNRPRCRIACYAINHLPVILHDFLVGCDSDEERIGLARDSTTSTSSDTSNPAASP